MTSNSQEKSRNPLFDVVTLGIIGASLAAGFLLGNRYKFNDILSIKNNFTKINPNTNDKNNVLIIGDSTTWGYNGDNKQRLPFNCRYPNVVQNYFLNSPNPELNSINIVSEGLNARTVNNPDIGHKPYTLSVMDVIDVLLHTHKPIDLVCIMIGINDQKFRYNNSKKILTNSYKLLVNKIIKSQVFRETGPKRILLMIPTKSVLTDQSKEWGWNDKSIELNNDFPIIFNELKQHFNKQPKVKIDVFDTNNYIVTCKSDGIHIDAPNNIKLGTYLAPKIATMLDIKHNITVDPVEGKINSTQPTTI